MIRAEFNLFVEHLLTQVLDIDSFLHAFPVDDGRLGKFLTLAEFFPFSGMF